MRLIELAAEYRESARLLKERIQELRALIQDDKDMPDNQRIKMRIKALRSMYRETTEIAVLLEKYYDREYKRNARFTI